MTAPSPRLAALLVTGSVTVLAAVAVILVVDGLEWSLLSLLGVPLLPSEILLGLTALPLLVLVARFAARVWRIERGLKATDDPDTPSAS